MKRMLLVGLILISISHWSNAQLSGGGDLNPDLTAPEEAQKEWMDRRIGLSVHWGPSALSGEEISWSRDSKIPKEIYDNYYKSFNPDKFEAEEWARLMKRWGIRYMAPTSKHHDGFSLWFSAFTEYDMENAKLKIDIMEELARACKKNDIMLGAYYSNLDWYHPDWFPYQYGGPGQLFEKRDDSPNLDRYFTFFENQVIELIRKYDLDFFQFDGEWDSTYTHEVGSRLYRRFHEEKKAVLLSSRIDIGRRSAGNGNHLDMDGKKYAGDYQERERVVNHGNNIISWLDHPWQAWVTIDKTQWSYNEDPQLMTTKELIRDLVSVIGNNGNYMINLGSRPDGSFEPEQIALLDDMGRWLKEHGEAVYGTRGGPFYPFDEGVSTRNGNKAWLFILDTKAERIALPKLSQTLKSAYLFGTEKRISFKKNKSKLLFNIPQQKGVPVRVVELTFNAPVEMSPKDQKLEKYKRNGAKQMTKDINYELSTEHKDWHQSIANKGLFNNDRVSTYSFHTQNELNPYIKLDLGDSKEIHWMVINNRVDCCKERAKNLTVWISQDNVHWKKYWNSVQIQDQWEVPFEKQSMGATIPGIKTRYIKVGLVNKEEAMFHLSKIKIFAK